MHDLTKTLEEKMQKAFDSLLHQFGKLRTGRASAAILDDIRVDYYGQPTPIKQICNVTIPEPRTIVVQPWDKSTLAEIEKQINAANLGVHPVNDGNVVRLPFPQLNEEKRKDIVKQVKKLAEDTKVVMRNIRRDGNEQAKKLKKDSEITEDEEKKLEDEIQKLTDSWIEKAGVAATAKEKEVMEV
jgi:ribosome recycling factor